MSFQARFQTCCLEERDKNIERGFDPLADALKQGVNMRLGGMRAYLMYVLQSHHAIMGNQMSCRPQRLLEASTASVLTS